MQFGLSPLQGQQSFEETLREGERAEATASSKPLNECTSAGLTRWSSDPPENSPSSGSQETGPSLATPQLASRKSFAFGESWTSSISSAGSQLPAFPAKLARPHSTYSPEKSCRPYARKSREMESSLGRKRRTGIPENVPSRARSDSNTP